MMDELIATYRLEKYGASIRASAESCSVGRLGQASCTKGCTKLGGLPDVPHEFKWPHKDGRPLAFVGQVRCSEITLIPADTGLLSFFYDDRHRGYSPKNAGHAAVYFHDDDTELVATLPPQARVKSLFGLLKRTVRPNVYSERQLQFEPGVSYPSIETGLVELADVADEEGYREFLHVTHNEIQMFGHPYPIQDDDLAARCAKVTGLGNATDWVLLLQLEEVCGVTMGDAGVQYWFIPKRDLAAPRFDRVWLVVESH